MHCPSCGYILQKLAVTTNSGGRFDIDHCGRCGGTWFDPFEINRIPYHEVTQIAYLTVLPKIPIGKSDKLICPRCHKILVHSHYESVPQGLRMLRCIKCGGIWATQKALEVFSKHEETVTLEQESADSAFPSLSVIFAPAIFTLLFFVSTFMSLDKLQDSRDTRIRAQQEISQPQFIQLSPTSVGVYFQTKSPFTSSISYGASSLELTVSTLSTKPSGTHRAILTGLKPYTTYFYRFTLEDEKENIIKSDLKSFQTVTE